MHFGELQDAAKGTAYTFLYLRKEKEHVGQTESDCRLFLFPRRLDLVVLGSTDAETLGVLAGLLENTEVDTLIVSADVASADFRGQELPAAGKTVRLEGGSYQTELGDWHFLVRAFAGGTVAVAYGLSADVQESGLEDCVMSIKELRAEALCRKELSPDGYGCALGCALYQDYDVCKYREKGGQAMSRTGTLLFGGGEDEASCRELLSEARENIGEIRFFGFAPGRTSGDADGSASAALAAGASSGSASAALAAGASSGSTLAVPAAGVSAQIAAVKELFAEEADEQEKGFRRYFIGTEELDDEAIAELGRGGWRQRSIVLQEGEGICCSGLLKYAQ